jgi:hypothetical protein
MEIHYRFEDTQVEESNEKSVDNLRSVQTSYAATSMKLMSELSSLAKEGAKVMHRVLETREFMAAYEVSLKAKYQDFSLFKGIRTAFGSMFRRSLIHDFGRTPRQAKYAFECLLKRVYGEEYELSKQSKSRLKNRGRGDEVQDPTPPRCSLNQPGSVAKHICFDSSGSEISCNLEVSSPGFNDLQDVGVDESDDDSFDSLPGSHSSAGGDDAITLMVLHGSATPDAAVMIATENGGPLALDSAENEQHLAAGDEAESTHRAHSILSVYQPSPSQVPLISKEVETILRDEQDIPVSIPWTEVWNSKEYVNSLL